MDTTKPPAGICCEDVSDYLTSACTDLNQTLLKDYMYKAAQCRNKPNCISQAAVTPKCFQAISRPTQGFCNKTTISFNTCVLNQDEADYYGARETQVAFSSQCIDILDDHKLDSYVETFDVILDHLIPTLEIDHHDGISKRMANS